MRRIKQTFTSSSVQPVQRQNRRIQKNHLLFELSKLGQPGAKDDPMRKGLSCAGVRRYLQLLHEIDKSEEARKQALRRRSPKNTPREKQKADINSEHITPPTGLWTKKKRTSALKT